MHSEFTSNFLIGENGVLYLTVGSLETPEGPGFFDSAVLFCPFCGNELQRKEEIEKSVRPDDTSNQ
jgi:hypothetical protein